MRTILKILALITLIPIGIFVFTLWVLAFLAGMGYLTPGG